MTTEQPRATTASTDLLDQLLGAEPGSALVALRQQRASVARFTQESYRALLHPEDAAGVSLLERGQIALRAALRTPSAQLADHYREHLVALGATPPQIAAVERVAGDQPHERRLALLLEFTDQLIQAPRAATPANLAALTDTSLSTRDVVTVAQLIAFVSYQARVLAGLRAIGEAL
jgi:CMD domain protein